MSAKISVISLISYDASFLPRSIASYYDYVDEIILGLDENRISWSGNKVSFDEDKLWDDLQKLDIQGKRTVIEDNFHRSSNPVENDTHERNVLKEHCSHDLVLSFDADEILVNAKEFFVDYLPLIEDRTDVELMFTWYLLYKDIPEKNGYLIISDETRQHIFKKDIQGFSANRKLHTYHYCRWTNAPKKLLSPLAILHYSFCRTDKELDDKINNFTHSVESKVDPFYAVQRSVNYDNYKELLNFKTHGAGAQWPTLQFMSRDTMHEYLQQEARLIYEN